MVQLCCLAPRTSSQFLVQGSPPASDVIGHFGGVAGATRTYFCSRATPATLVPATRRGPPNVEAKDNSFISIRYVSDKVCAAMQMFDLTRLLLILARPEHSRQERATRLAARGDVAQYYASRVVANSVVNRGDITWVNAVQLLTPAGLTLIGWMERKALVKCLDDFHIQTGWNTQGNIDELLGW